MTHQTIDRPEITGGVDTHLETHHGAVIDRAGRLLGDREFPADAGGYRQLLAWMLEQGDLQRVGVEGTGSYGAGLARHLTASGIELVEVDRPDRRTRRAHGKSDPIDAVAAARAALSGTAEGTPKARTGPVEALRALRTARSGAVKARTAAVNAMHGLVTSAPEQLRAELRTLTTTQLVARAAAFRVRDELIGAPAEATRAALQSLARRARDLEEEIRLADRRITDLVGRIAPALTALLGVGPHTAAQLLITAGDNPDRIGDDAAFARLCGAAPIPASSGRTDRHRLHRGGDRQANSALHTITLVRMRHDQRTRDYVARRTAQGLTKKEIMRCLKRYIAREIINAIHKDLTRLKALDGL